jgi:hypothetical protein
VLGAEAGVAGRFYITRALFYEIVFGLTVVTVAADMTRYLLDVHREQDAVDLLVRVAVERPNDNWEGFIGFDDDAQPVSHAFVVERVVTAKYPWMPEDNEEPSS